MIARRWLIVLFALAITAAACASSDDTTTTTTTADAGTTTTEAAATTTAEPTTTTTEAPPDPVSLTVLTGFFPNGYQSALFAGKAEGFFDDEFIDLTIEPGAGSAGDNAKIAAGAADLDTYNAYGATALNISEGIPVRAVMYTYANSPSGMCYIEERTTIEDWEDFEGLTQGGPAGSAITLELFAAMEFFGADPEAVESVVIEFLATIPALIADQVDVTGCSLLTLAPRTAAAEEAGLTLGFFSFAEDGGFAVIGWGVVAADELIEENPSAVQRFVNAYARSVLWSIENPDAACAHFLDANPDKTEEIECPSFKGTIPLYTDANGDYFVGDSPDQVALTLEFIETTEGTAMTYGQIYTSQFYDAMPEHLKEGRLEP